MKKSFHSILKENFKDRNLSELSRQLEIPRSVLQDWIKDEREPSFKNLAYIKKIANYLGMGLGELLTGEEEVHCKVLNAITFEDEGKRYQVLINRIK